MDERVSLESAKSTFQSLLSGLDPADAANFVEWVRDLCSAVHCTDMTPENVDVSSREEETMNSIVEHLTQRVPFEGTLRSEEIHFPEGGPVIILFLPIFFATQYLVKTQLYTGQ